VPLIQQPASQVPLQTSPLGHAAFGPFVVVHDDVDVPGWQLWQTLDALVAPVMTTDSLMSHSDPHAPATQISPLPQLVPSWSDVQLDVVAVGAQI
jgi:hypothetical protein